MINLPQASVEDIRKFATDLFMKYRSGLASFEAAAQVATDAVYNTFRQTNGQPTFALVRIFRAMHYNQLPSHLKSLANSDITDTWLVLNGTAGDIAAWGSPAKSVGHQVIPAISSATPMLKAAFEQLQFNSMKPIDPNALQLHQAQGVAPRYFYVPNALGSPHIPTQDEFVKPYKIQSVVGIGSTFVSKSFYLGLFFSKVALSQDDVEKFIILSPYLSTLLAFYDN